MNAEVRAAVLSRANGHCECPCGESLETFGGELDHAEGRKYPETVENCWMLTVDCHYQRTNGIPSAVFWLKAFQRHQRKHSYDSTRTGNRLFYAETKAAMDGGVA